jgi:hypothetical protein
MPVVTVATFKASLPGTPLALTDDDAAFATELALAEGDLAAACAWPVADDGSHGFETATYTAYLDGPETSRPNILRLPVPHVASITSVHQATDDVYDTSALVASTDYALQSPGELVSLRSGLSTWWSLHRAQKVVLVGGWAEGAAPASVQSAVLAQARHRWLTLRPAAGRTQTTVAGKSVSRQDASEAVSPIALAIAQASPLWRWGDHCG